MATGAEEKELRDIVGILEKLIGSGGYRETLQIIVEKALALSGANRTCVIMRDKKEGLVIKAGCPRMAHGIDQPVTPEKGKNFLEGVMSGGSVVIVDSPKRDPRTAYMRELAETHDISLVMFFPLYYREESLGVLVLDFVGANKRVAKQIYRKIVLFSNLASVAIGSEYERGKHVAQVATMERLYGLGENTARIAHTFRNALAKIGGWSNLLLKEEFKHCPDPEALKREAARIIAFEIGELESLVNNVMDFASPKQLDIERIAINGFLRDEMKSFTLRTVGFEFDLDRRLEAVTIGIDRKLMSAVVSDLVRNAIEASASRIRFKTRFKLSDGVCSIRVKISNNGQTIESDMLECIFSPFVTTKSKGTGLGLANVRSIIVAHGGEITVESGAHLTAFTIVLPLA